MQKALKLAPKVGKRLLTTAQRDVEETDVVIVGAGPSSLAAAIKVRLNAIKSGRDVRVLVVEKGAEVGSHILSGAVLEPRALDELIPDWKSKGAPLNTKVTREKMHLMTER